VIKVHHVDGVDRGVGVRVGGQQNAAGTREQVHRRFQELNAVHLGHSVVGHQQRGLLAAQLDLTQRFQRLLAGARPHDPVTLAVSAPQIPSHRPRHSRIVVHSQDSRTTHAVTMAHAKQCAAIILARAKQRAAIILARAKQRAANT
jgi:hypothetical protein